MGRVFASTKDIDISVKTVTGPLYASTIGSDICAKLAVGVAFANMARIEVPVRCAEGPDGVTMGNYDDFAGNVKEMAFVTMVDSVHHVLTATILRVTSAIAWNWVVNMPACKTCSPTCDLAIVSTRRH